MKQTVEEADLFIKSKAGNIYPVRKYVKSDDGEQHIWCNEWYGHHVIGRDCEWAASLPTNSIDFLSVLDENLQAQIAGYYNDDKTDAEREKRNAVIEEYKDLIAIWKSKQAHTTNSMQWVRASERLPTEPANARYNNLPGILIPVTGGCMFHGYNQGWGYSENEPGLQWVEWLESAPTEPNGNSSK